jgi:hypothetical protein
MRLARALPAAKIPASSGKCYLFPSPDWQWVVRFLKFHRHGGEWRHPRVLPASAMAEFLSDLSVRLGLGRCGAILEPSRPSSAKGQASGHSTEDSEEHL